MYKAETVVFTGSKEPPFVNLKCPLVLLSLSFPDSSMKYHQYDDKLLLIFPSLSEIPYNGKKMVPIACDIQWTPFSVAIHSLGCPPGTWAPF